MLLRAMVLAVFLLLPLKAFADDGVIATVMEVEGSATITPADGKAHPAALNDTLGINDEVSTGAGARVFLLFIDDTQLTLSENSRFKATDYAFNDKDFSGNHARYSFITGTFDYLSGLMTKKPQPDVQIQTAYGSIGVRGTHLWSGATDKGYGVHVDEGVIDVVNDGGKVTVKAGEGTDVRSRRDAPTRAAAWSRERREKIRQTIQLKHADVVAKRIAQNSSRQQELRGRFRDFMEKRKAGGMNGNANGRGEQLQQRQEQRQEQMQERRQKILQQYQQNGDNRQQIQQQRQQQIEERRQKIEQLRTGNAGGTTTTPQAVGAVRANNAGDDATLKEKLEARRRARLQGVNQ